MSAKKYLKQRSIIKDTSNDLEVGFTDGSSVSIIELMESYAKHSQSERERKLYEALEEIKILCDGNDDVQNKIWHIANRALKTLSECKPKDV